MDYPFEIGKIKIKFKKKIYEFIASGFVFQ